MRPPATRRAVEDRRRPRESPGPGAISREGGVVRMRKGASAAESVGSWRTALGMLAFLLALPACGCARPPRAPLRLGVNVWPPYELLYLARERGYFRDEGVEVTLVDLSSYTGILRAYHRGRIDGLLATLNEVQIRDNFQDPPAVVLAVDDSSGGDGLVARRGIDRLQDLRGRRVACEESALGSYVLDRVLGAAGLERSDVVLLNRLPEEGEADFRAGRVDAVVTYEPFLGRLEREAGGRVLFSSLQMPGEIVDVLALRRAVIAERGDEIRGLVRAWFRALHDLRAHPREAAAIMARREGLTPDELLRALEGSHIPDHRENLRLIGTLEARGRLAAVADRLAAFLERRGLARRAARGDETLDPAILESL